MISYERPACVNCQTFAPEVLVPVGDGAEPMCWLCAHVVTEHDVPIGTPVTACACDAAEIYPEHIVRLRAEISRLRERQGGIRVISVGPSEACDVRNAPAVSLSHPPHHAGDLRAREARSARVSVLRMQK